MATFKSPAEFVRALERMERDIEREYPRIGKEMAEKARPEAYRAAAADLGGDPKFSGWKPWLKLEVKAKPFGAVLMPTRQSAGPWTVAEIGRNQGNASGFAGPGVNRKTGLTARTKSGGLRKVRAVKAKRWNGYTAGKGTATDAAARIDKAVADIPEKRLRVVMRRHVDTD